jgi:DNA polymerase III epsilon subunit family exonuclease
MKKDFSYLMATLLFLEYGGGLPLSNLAYAADSTAPESTPTRASRFDIIYNNISSGSLSQNSAASNDNVSILHKRNAEGSELDSVANNKNAAERLPNADGGRLQRWDKLFGTNPAEKSTGLFKSFFDTPEASVKVAEATTNPIHTKSPARAVSCLTPASFTYHPNFPMHRKERFLALLPASKRMVFFDTETTGLNKDYDRIIEIAFVYRDYNTMEETRWYALINSEGKESGALAFAAHHIPDADLVDEKMFEELADPMLAFVGDNMLVAHNAQFDMKMINASLQRAERDIFPPERFQCTLKKSEEIYGRGGNKLDNVCTRYGVSLESRKDCHGAMQDTLLLADVYPMVMLDHYQNAKS